MQTEDKLIPFHSTDPTGWRVLVLAPHPDDETIGCGGSLALHAAAGDPVKVIFLTNGAKGDTSGEMEKNRYVALRQKEAKKACKTLGVMDLEFWLFEDRSLSGAHGALRRMMDLLKSYRPQLVYAPSPLEFHPDHRAACFLLCDAISGMDVSFQVAFYEVGQPVCVNTLVDITPVLDRKDCAIACYQSQLNEQPYGDIVMGLNRYRSMTLPESITHAEGFSRWPSGLIQKIGPLSIPFHRVHRLAPDPEKSGPLVSIIVRTKDRPNLLANAMRSITTQTYPNLEIVVVNDGGQNVLDMVQSLSGDIPIQYVDHEKCRGRASAANSGLKAARGKYCNFLDDDDVFYPDHAACLVGHLEISREKVAFSNVLNVFFSGPPENPQNREKEERVFNFDFDPDRLLFENYIPIMSVLFSRETLTSVKGFSEGLTLFEDWDFWMRLSRHFPFHHVDRTTAEYRFYGTSGMAASHRTKYHYDQARAVLFDRALPHMNGRAWAAFQKPFEEGRPREDADGRRHENIPLNAPDVVSDHQAQLRDTQVELANLRQTETQLCLKNAALESRISALSSSLARIQEKPAIRIRRKMKKVIERTKNFWHHHAEKGVDKSKPTC